MKISELSKEQKQYVILGALVGIILIYVSYNFGIRPFFEKLATSRVEYEELKTQVEEGRRNVNRTSSVLLDLDNTYGELTELSESYIAPADHAYTWVTEKIYFHAREAELDVESISEYPPNLPWNSVSDGREFSGYGVRVVTACSYAKLRELIASFEESNPLLVVSGVKIGTTEDPLRHKVQIHLEWPIWTSPDGPNTIHNSAELEEGAS